MVKPRCSVVERKSAAVSPTVVAVILMIQKTSVTSGTLFSIFVNNASLNLSGGVEQEYPASSHGNLTAR